MKSLAATRQVLASAERTSGSARRATPPYTKATVRARLARRRMEARRRSAAIDPHSGPTSRRGRHQGQLEDLAFFLRSYADTVDASPARLQEVEDRLALLGGSSASTVRHWATSSSAATIWRASRSC